MSKLIPLSRGYSAIVDDADFDWISQWNWSWASCGRAKGYSVRGDYSGDVRKTVYMHRIIAQAMLIPDNVHIDHGDTNTLNNMRNNLRAANPSQNRANANKKRGHFTSQFKGVSWYPLRNKWRVHVKKKCVGYFSSELDAARAYDDAAREYFGEFARTNF